jgi:hypothetical protein
MLQEWRMCFNNQETAVSEWLMNGVADMAHGDIVGQAR